MFLARLFNELGVRTSHEEFFTAYTPLSSVFTFGQWLERTRTIGEVSGLAAPWLASVASVQRALLIRNPVAVIASLMGLRDLHPESHPLANIKYNFRHLPMMSRDDDPIILAMKYWLHWNRLASREDPSLKMYRVEQVSKDQGQHALRMLLEIGVDCCREDCKDVLAKLGTHYNGGPRDPSISWRTLPKGELKDAIATDALVYGYTMDDLESYCPLGEDCPHCGPEREKI